MPGSSPGMTMERVTTLQNKTHRPQQSQLLGIQNRPALGDLQPAALAPELVAVMADEHPGQIVDAVAVHDEVRRHRYHLAVDAGDADVADQPPRPRGRIFGVAVRVLEPDDAL